MTEILLGVVCVVLGVFLSNYFRSYKVKKEKKQQEEELRSLKREFMDEQEKTYDMAIDDLVASVNASRAKGRE